jgi:hypothetical protein
MTTIAEVLHRAADKCLPKGERDDYSQCSCVAAEAAAGALTPMALRVSAGLEEMGVPTDPGCFDEFEPGIERQSVRYAWLKFAAMIAEEQGV